MLSVDFTDGVIPVHEGDVFFLDSNVVVAFLYELDPFHTPTYLFLKYLKFCSANLVVSHVVIAEAIHILAKCMYADDQMQAVGGRLSSHRSKWHTQVLKHEPDVLSEYNGRASTRLLQFLEGVLVIPGKEKEHYEALELCVSVPLASYDAFIAVAVCNLQPTALISLDRDLQRLQDIPLYTTSIMNDEFEAKHMIQMLGTEFEEFLKSIETESGVISYS